MDDTESVGGDGADRMSKFREGHLLGCEKVFGFQWACAPGCNVTPEVDHILTLADEDLLFSFLDENLNANGATPHIAGVDADGDPFMAWLDEEGGDCVGLRVCRLLGSADGGAESPSIVEAPWQGQATGLAYPVHVIDVRSSPATTNRGGER